MKELRIPFPDYTPEEQERDVERFKLLEKKYQPHAFMLKVDVVWAHLIFSEGKPYHRFYEDKTLIEAYQELHKKYPRHKVKYIINQGLEDYLRIERKREHRFIELKINFKER